MWLWRLTSLIQLWEWASCQHCTIAQPEIWGSPSCNSFKWCKPAIWAYWEMCHGPCAPWSYTDFSIYLKVWSNLSYSFWLVPLKNFLLLLWSHHNTIGQGMIKVPTQLFFYTDFLNSYLYQNIVIISTPLLPSTVYLPCISLCQTCSGSAEGEGSRF